MISLKQLTQEDAPQLFEFECQNRIYFESMIPGRGDDYYHYPTFLQRHDALLTEQADGLSTFHLILDEHKRIIGRINLVDIHHHCAHIGYRIGEHHVGKGIATNALTLLISHTRKLKLIHTLYAKTTTTNIPSQRVLTRNNFTCTHTETLDCEGESIQFLHYQLSFHPPHEEDLPSEIASNDKIYSE
ncbi:GNAT family N-acetyltransferase [Mechercharimyces sp. CAU 1602]|uniref:GNAT family N-acetyltransferase n=1 Tax=Mechercharimyces sp. CAU 1602 TaxID=2973933 RepID=UPI002162B129|nr:GNAT family N-acetyltransferase [Mechercharimyces sp. CAU 1602]MCS1351330.1 GNAT family N-acetyltransferase [Mechercharimyces sp. CAU 1602]